jgi:hypothetical protein
VTYSLRPTDTLRSGESGDLTAEERGCNRKRDFETHSQTETSLKATRLDFRVLDGTN